MDDKETLHRRAKLRELIRERFADRTVDLIQYIQERTGKKPNQGELSALQKDDSGKSFGDKKAKTLAEQIGLPRRWFDMPLGTAPGTSGLEPEISESTAAAAIPENVKPKRGPSLEPNQDIQAVVDLMRTTDDRGRQKIRLAAEDALAEHIAHLKRAGIKTGSKLTDTVLGLKGLSESPAVLSKQEEKGK